MLERALVLYCILQYYCILSFPCDVKGGGGGAKINITMT